MSDKEQIEQLYRDYWKYMIAKDIASMDMIMAVAGGFHAAARRWMLEADLEHGVGVLKDWPRAVARTTGGDIYLTKLM